jgi:hypothetical protein
MDWRPPYVWLPSLLRLEVRVRVRVGVRIRVRLRVGVRVGVRVTLWTGELPTSGYLHYYDSR